MLLFDETVKMFGFSSLFVVVVYVLMQSSLKYAAVVAAADHDLEQKEINRVYEKEHEI